MDIEIRRNRDVSVSFEMSEETRGNLAGVFGPEERKIAEYNSREQKRFEDAIWPVILENDVRDLDGLLVKPETHEICYEWDEPDQEGYCQMKNWYVRPKKSEYEK